MERRDAQGHVIDEEEAAATAADDTPCENCTHPFNMHGLAYADGITTLERSRAAVASCVVCDCTITLP